MAELNRIDALTESLERRKQRMIDFVSAETGDMQQSIAAFTNEVTADMDDIVSDAESTITALVGRVKSKQSAYVPSKKEKAMLSEAPGLKRVGEQLKEVVKEA